MTDFYLGLSIGIPAGAFLTAGVVWLSVLWLRAIVSRDIENEEL